jgi:hypothetical protein
VGALRGINALSKKWPNDGSRAELVQTDTLISTLFARVKKRGSMLRCLRRS